MMKQSFKEYCDNLYQDCVITNLKEKRKPRCRLQDLQRNPFDPIQKEEFQRFVQTAIHKTKNVRQEAYKTASEAFGVNRQWERAKKEYFPVQETYRKVKLDLTLNMDSQSVNYKSWRRKDLIYHQRNQSMSLGGKRRIETRW